MTVTVRKSIKRRRNTFRGYGMKLLDTKNTLKFSPTILIQCRWEIFSFFHFMWPRDSESLKPGFFPLETQFRRFYSLAHFGRGASFGPESK